MSTITFEQFLLNNYSEDLDRPISLQIARYPSKNQESHYKPTELYSSQYN